MKRQLFYVAGNVQKEDEILLDSRCELVVRSSGWISRAEGERAYDRAFSKDTRE